MNGRRIGTSSNAMTSQDMVKKLLPRNRLGHSMPSKAKVREKDTGKDRRGKGKAKERAIGSQARGGKEAAKARTAQKALGLRNESAIIAAKKDTSNGSAQSL